MGEITIKTIAEKAGVSPSLVSKVLNERPVRVSDEKREYIKTVAKKYHYVPNKLAASLKSKRTKVIAVVAPFTPNGYFSNLIYHIQRESQRKGYLNMVINTFDNDESEVEALELYKTGLFDGMIIAPKSGSSNLDILNNIVESGFPLIFVDRYQEKIKIPCVSTRHFDLGYRLVNEAIKKGLQNIVYLYNAQDKNSALFERMNGYAKAMEDSHFPVKEIPFYISDGESTEAAMARALKGLDKEPECVFMHSGFYIPSLILACKSLDYDFNSISFITVDNFDLSIRHKEVSSLLEALNGRVAVALQDVRAIAISAVEVLLSRIEGEEVETVNDFKVEIMRL